MKTLAMQTDVALELLSKLKEKDLARQGFMVLEGRIVIEKALNAGIVPHQLVCTEAEEAYWKGNSTFPVHVMSHEALCALVDFKFHRGAIAIAEMPQIARFEMAKKDLAAKQAAMPGMECPEGADEEAREAFLCLWDITDPSNLGALIRTAAALGASGVLLGPGCANPYYRKAIRASMGNVFSIPLWSADIAVLESLGQKGVRIVAATLGNQALPLEASKNRIRNKEGGALVLILGNEGYGLPQEVIERCTDEVCIPMARGVDSLNVAVAGGILMYEFLG